MKEFQCKVSYENNFVKNSVRICELPPLTCFKDAEESLWMTLGDVDSVLDMTPNCRAAVNLNSGYVGLFSNHWKVQPQKSSLKVIEEISEDAFLEAVKNFDDDDEPQRSKFTSPFSLQNRYQDGGWEMLEKNIVDLDNALIRAKRCSKDAICYGMVRVMDANGTVVRTYSAGGGIHS